MYAQSDNQYLTTCSLLEKRISDCDFNIRSSKANMVIRDEHQAAVERYKRQIDVLDGIKNMLKPVSKDIQDYITARREGSLNNINNAIRMASEIIQDASAGVKFVLDKDEAYVSTSDGLDVQDVEGGGFRTITSEFLRSVVLRADPELLQTIFLDEAFATVSGRNSATLSTYLNIIVQDQQVISIEQKPEIGSNVPHITYLIEKDNDYSRVTRLKDEEAQ